MENIELFVLDMDGTLYLGDEIIDGAIEFIRKIADSGRQYIYLTNNSSRAGADYVTRLQKMGFPCEAKNIFTSGMATAEYLSQNHAGESVYLVGTRAFEAELKKAGVYITEEDPSVIVVGFDTELNYHKLEVATKFLRRGAKFIAANPDWVCPMPENEVLPDCGSICALLTAATGVEPYYIGKPNRNMVDIISKLTAIPNKNIACVGDRLYTDIAVAKNAKAISICVLSGETSIEEIEKSDIKPDYIFKSVKEIL